MKIKMTEYFQGTNQPTLTEGREYDSADIGQGLCNWLLLHRKALDVTPEHKPEPEPKKPVAVVKNEPETAPVKNTPKKAAPRARKPRARAKKNEEN